ncbi:MAG: hypothetical protein OEY79_02185 [Anaplasmataceae bacterium]|nr:hypothetical protein [Anaplasmataceae bacterium]
MQIVSLILLFFCFTANGMTTKEFLDYCKENNLKCTVNEDHSQHQHVSGEVVNDFHSPCEKGEKTCIDTSKKDKIAMYCKSGDENC